MANLYTDIKLFDAEYYLANNPDVAAAIQGTDITAQDHYFLHGAAESLTGGTEDGSRAPNAWFNAAEYVAQNPDLADVDANLLLAHFALHGVNEGRAPNAATAGADGKIKPALLADYVNAEGNEDVKDAIAEITGTPVGAELTAEQAAIAAQHFFAYGINEGRKGGIADEISGDDGDVEEAIIEALEAYQAALTAQEAAVKAEKEVIKSAAEHKEVTLDKDATAKEAADAVKDAIEGDDGAAEKVIGASDNTITGDITDAKIANAEKALKAKVDAAQVKVDAQAANAPTVIALQQQLKAQADAVEAANEVNTNYKAEVAKFEIANKELKVALKKADPDTDTPAESVPFHATIGEKFVVTVIDGKTVVYSGKLGDAKWKDGVPGDLKVATAKELEAVKGLDALLANIVAVEGNFAALAKANAAVEAAIVKALKAEGYKLFKADGKSADWKEAFDEAGKLVSSLTIAKSYDEKAEEGDKFVDDLKSESAFYTPAVQTVETDVVAKGGADFSDDEIEGTLSLTGTPLENTEAGKAAVNSAKAVKELTDAQDDLKAFQEAVESYNELKALQTELADAAKDVEAAGKAVAEAEKAFADLDINLVKADEDGAASGDAYDEDDAEQFADLFVFSSGLKTVDNFDGDDLFFFGDAAVALVVADKANLAAGKQLGGQADVLEIFAVQDGANTVLYVEKEAFAGNSSNLVDENNKDFVKIELVGVNAEDLQFNDGFLTLA